MEKSTTLGFSLRYRRPRAQGTILIGSVLPTRFWISCTTSTAKPVSCSSAVLNCSGLSSSQKIARLCAEDGTGIENSAPNSRRQENEASCFFMAGSSSESKTVQNSLSLLLLTCCIAGISVLFGVQWHGFQASYKSIPSSGMRQAEFVRVTRASVLILLGLAAHPGNVSDIDLHDVLGKPAVDQVLHFVGDLVERELPGAIEQF